jgi:hypothetical protein
VIDTDPKLKRRGFLAGLLGVAAAPVFTDGSHAAGFAPWWKFQRWLGVGSYARRAPDPGLPPVSGFASELRRVVECPGPEHWPPAQQVIPGLNLPLPPDPAPAAPVAAGPADPFIGTFVEDTDCRRWCPSGS